MRVVLDTNILIGALITKGTPPDRLYQAWLRGEMELVTSSAQMAELANVLARPRLQDFIDADEASVIVENIGTRALILDEPPGVSLSRDPKDNPILAAAVAGKADLIVSGDKRHILALGKVAGIPVVTAREALERLEPRNSRWQESSRHSGRCCAGLPPLAAAPASNSRRESVPRVCGRGGTPSATGPSYAVKSEILRAGTDWQGRLSSRLHSLVLGISAAGKPLLLTIRGRTR